MKEIYEAQVTAFVAHEEKYLANKGKAFTLIYGQYNKALQHKLQARTAFEDKIKGNLIKLLDAIAWRTISLLHST